jgi:hypothetical protein
MVKVLNSIQVLCIRAKECTDLLTRTGHTGGFHRIGLSFVKEILGGLCPGLAIPDVSDSFRGNVVLFSKQYAGADYVAHVISN